MVTHCLMPQVFLHKLTEEEGVKNPDIPIYLGIRLESQAGTCF